METIVDVDEETLCPPSCGIFFLQANSRGRYSNICNQQLFRYSDTEYNHNPGANNELHEKNQQHLPGYEELLHWVQPNIPRTRDNIVKQYEQHQIKMFAIGNIVSLNITSIWYRWLMPALPGSTQTSPRSICSANNIWVLGLALSNPWTTKDSRPTNVRILKDFHICNSESDIALQYITLREAARRTVLSLHPEV